MLAGELASETLFDDGVEAARNACVAGASIASAAMTAAAWYSNPLTGMPALRACMQRVAELPLEVEAWHEALRSRADSGNDGSGYAPGFGFVKGVQADAIVRACGRLVDARLAELDMTRTAFFARHAQALCSVTGPLNHAGLAALVFVDHDCDPDEAERQFLLCRLEVAIAEAQRARRGGVARFPFFEQEYVYEGSWPVPRSFDLEELKRRVGLD